MAGRAIRPAVEKRDAQRGILEGSVGGAAVKMDERKAFDGNQGLELPIAFSSLSRDKKWKLRSLRLLNSSRFA